MEIMIGTGRSKFRIGVSVAAIGMALAAITWVVRLDAQVAHIQETMRANSAVRDTQLTNLSKQVDRLHDETSQQITELRDVLLRRIK